MTEICPSLPSAEVAYRLVRPDVRAFPSVLGTVAFRALLIGIGLRWSNDWKPRAHLLRDALFASSVIETFVIGWALYQTRRQKDLS